jgi:hypothetical protein
MELKWKKDALERPILHKSTLSGGVGEEPMPIDAFTNIFKISLRNSGYVGVASVYSIRRALGKKVDGEEPLACAYTC